MSGSDRGCWIRETVERYQAPLLRYAVHLTGSLDAARDVVQDTFFRLCEADRTTVEGHLSAWLFRVCRNRALDLQRKDRPMQAMSDGFPEASEAEQPSPAQRAEARQATVRLLSLMAALPGRQQELLRLKFQEGLSYLEIAEVTGETVSNVGFLLHRALRRLRAQMESSERTPSRSVP